MTINYLQQTASVQLDGNGAGIVSLSPSVGQFWAPTFVRVSTRTRMTKTTPGPSGGLANLTFNMSCAAHCQLFFGAATVTDATTIIDETYLGWGDTSSIISGAIVQFGESITAQFDGGTANDTAVITVYGRSSSSLTALTEVMSEVIPGLRFTGSSGNSLLWDTNTFNLLGNVQRTFRTMGDLAVTLPSDCLAELTYVRFDVTTSATVGARFVGLRARSGGAAGNPPIGTEYFAVYNGATQAENLSTTYIFINGINNFNAPFNAGCALPNKLILSPGSIIEGIPGSSQVGDTYSNVHIAWKQYKSLTKQGYM